MILKWIILHNEYFHFWYFKYILKLILCICIDDRVFLHRSILPFTIENWTSQKYQSWGLLF